MTDKKIIIFAIILSALLIGGAWYYSKQSLGLSPSGALPSSTTLTEVSEAGILVGSSAAPVTMEEYTNFMCPACGRFATGVFERIKEDYIATGKVKMVIYVFPPLELSQAALCAQEQNKFMDFHSYAFAHQDQITSEDSIKDSAVNAGLDVQAFNNCYVSGKYKDKATKWYNEGVARSVESTPTFFINGQKLIGALPYEDFKKVIDQKLDQVK